MKKNTYVPFFESKVRSIPLARSMQINHHESIQPLLFKLRYWYLCPMWQKQMAR